VEEIKQYMPMEEKEMGERIMSLRARGEDILGEFKYSQSLLKEANLKFRQHVDTYSAQLKLENHS